MDEGIKGRREGCKKGERKEGMDRRKKEGNKEVRKKVKSDGQKEGGR